MPAGRGSAAGSVRFARPASRLRAFVPSQGYAIAANGCTTIMRTPACRENDPETRGPEPTRTRVAVVMPLYNHESYVREAVDSVLRQTLAPTRFIIVDDGSSDASVAAVAERITDWDGFPIELRTQRNRGAARTLNEVIFGLDEEVIAILNSDDAWHPERLERMVPTLSPDRPSLSFSGVDFFGDSTERDLQRNPAWMARLLAVAGELPSLGFAVLLGNLAISTGNFLFSRALFETVGGFDESMPIIHDWNFLLQSLRVAEPQLVPAALYRYRIHGSNTYRVNPDPTGVDLVHMHQSFFAWASQGADNPLAPIPAHYPRFYPFFLPIWLEFVAPRGGNVPRLLARLAAALRDSGVAGARDVERAAVARVYALTRKPRRAADAAALPELLAAAASHWTTNGAGVRPSTAAPRRCDSVSAEFVWADASVTVAAHESAVLDEIAAFTGLPPVAADVPLGRATLNVLGTRDVYVHDQHRRYDSWADRSIWLALTVGEFLANESEALLLHAASIRLHGEAVLFLGEPFAGKSTLAHEALRRGMVVMGDDQVRWDPETCRVQALPRPIKLRVPVDAELPPGLAAAGIPLRGRLDGEETLMLPRGAGHTSPAEWYPVRRMVHLTRRDDPGCSLETIRDEKRVRRWIGAQLRGALARHSEPFEHLARGLLAAPQMHLAVGTGATDRALDLLLRRIDGHP